MKSPNADSNSSSMPIPILFGAECFDGGVLRHLVYLLSHLDPKRFQPHLIVSRFRSSPQAVTAIEQLKSKNVEIKRLAMYHALHPVYDLGCLLEIIRYIKHNRIEIVHAHSTKAGLLFRLAGRLCGVKTVYTPHCYYFLAHKGLNRRLYIATERLLGKLTCKTILAGNERNIALENRIIHASAIAVIDNAIDPACFPIHPRREACRKQGLLESDFIVGGVGRLCRQKNWTALIRAAYRILRFCSSVTFVIAGEGEEKEKLQTLIDQLGIGSKFRLFDRIDDITSFYPCLNLFVSTSLWEGLPYAFLEAEHYRIPMMLPDISFMSRRFPHALYYSVSDQEGLFVSLLECITGNMPRVSDDSHVSDFELFIHRHQCVYEQISNRTHVSTENLIEL